MIVPWQAAEPQSRVGVLVCGKPRKKTTGQAAALLLKRTRDAGLSIRRERLGAGAKEDGGVNGKRWDRRELIAP